MMWDLLKIARRTPPVALAFVGMIFCVAAGVGSAVGFFFDYPWWIKWGPTVSLAGTTSIAASLWWTAINTSSALRSRGKAARLALVGAVFQAIGDRDVASMTGGERAEALTAFNDAVEHIQRAFPEVSVVSEAAQARAAFAACLVRLNGGGR